MSCKKAIIAVGGYGTRRLPITKAIEKCMMPVGNRPIVDYIVEDCLAAGITNIIFVVGEQSAQMRTYYGSNPQLEEYLARENKTALLQDVQKLSSKARFTFVAQDRHQPYGTSVPLWLAREYVKDEESFLFLYGDSIFYNADGSSQVANFLAQAAPADPPTAMLGLEVPHDLVHLYGIIATEHEGNYDRFQKVVEKPRVGEAPGNLNSAGCFLLTPAIFPFVQRSAAHSPQAECLFTDAINWFSEAGNPIAVVSGKAEFLDCGSAAGWLHANNRIVGNQA